ncbi:nitrate ABC transporter ATP-binding protein, partial [Klebsiella pneumoniae]|nr:nitrate ABC transporter ATP-binding protein [Klebsiella pneumoniae]
RDRLDPAFRALVEDIYRRMTTRTPRAPVQEGLFAGMGMAMVLPRVSTNILAGLMEALAGSAYAGKADLPALAAELQYEADEL